MRCELPFLRLPSAEAAIPEYEASRTLAYRMLTRGSSGPPLCGRRWNPAALPFLDQFSFDQNIDFIAHQETELGHVESAAFEMSGRRNMGTIL